MAYWRLLLPEECANSEVVSVVACLYRYLMLL